MNVAIVGTGRMGFAQARIARYFGDEIVFGVDVSETSRARFADAFGVHVYATCELAQEAWECVDLTWVTVTDGAIAEVGPALKRCPSKGIVLHTSGALPGSILGIPPCGSMHPMMCCPLPDVEDEACVDAYRGVVHCVDGDEKAVALARRCVARLGGQCVEIDPADKAKYHAAAVFASNYPVVLIQTAMELLKSCGFDQETAHKASVRMMSQSCRSLMQAQPLEALTGPVKRRDMTTIARHRATLGESETGALYDALLKAAQCMCGWDRTK